MAKAEIKEYAKQTRGSMAGKVRIYCEAFEDFHWVTKEFILHYCDVIAVPDGLEHYDRECYLTYEVEYVSMRSESSRAVKRTRKQARLGPKVSNLNSSNEEEDTLSISSQ